MSVLVVVLGEEIAATISQLRDGRLRLDYDEAYRRKPDATPLSLSMPPQVASHADRAVAPWLWGLLPENPAVLRRWARDFQVSANSPFALLGTAVGEDCAGAVRFAPESGLDRILSRSGRTVWLTDEEVADRLRELRQDSTAWLANATTGQFSLAGAQAKTALVYRRGRWGLPSGSVPTTHILKPAVSGFDDHDLNEHLCLDAARRAGLLAARTEVRRFDDESAVVVTRYDRRDGRERVHQEDLCQALSIRPADKYQNAGGPSPADVARLLRDSMPAGAADDAVRRFADALIWNWIIAGTDAHGKNYSVLLAGSQVRLAPLYDVASFLPYKFDPSRLRFAMKLGGSHKVFATKSPWPEVARDLNVDPDELHARAVELTSAAPDLFADAARSPDVRALGRELPDRLAARVSEHAERNRRLLEERSSSASNR